MENLGFLKKLKQKGIKLMIQVRSFAGRDDGFGMNEILGIAMGLILVAFVILPKLTNLTTAIMEDLADWWTEISENISPGT